MTAILRKFAFMLLFAGGFFAAQVSALRAEAVEYVVFSIVGDVEGLTLGQMLKEGTRLDVPEGASIELISKNGETVTLAGPAVATVTTDNENKAGEKALYSISDMLFHNDRFVETLGGTRSTAHETDVRKFLSTGTESDGWVPLLSQVGSYCFRSGEMILRRGDASRDLMLQSQAAIRFWKAGEERIDLAGMFAGEDTPRELTIDGRKVQVTVAAQTGMSLAEQVAWMAANGCAHQGLRLLAGQGSQ